MSERIYFDCHALIGQRPQKPIRARWSTEHLLADMDLAEISAALVTHGVARSYDVLYGNARLRFELQKAPDRLFGVWCILPVGEPGFYRTGDEMIQAMAAENIRAVRLVPGGFSLHPEVVGETLETLQHHRILTLLEAGWASEDLFSTFHPLLSRYPHLPVLLTDHRWTQQRHVHRLMTLHDNLHVEFSAYQINRGFEQYAADFGDERLLFGTGMTDKSPGAARLFVDYAQLPEESKQKIAADNLKRLLGGVGPESCVQSRRQDDPILADARAGRPLQISVVDAHAHVLHDGGDSAGGRYVMYSGDAAGMLEVNRWCGIDRIALMSWNGPVCTDARDGNEITWRAMQQSGHQVIGVAVIDPTHMTPSEMEEEIRLRYLEQGFVGMKPYHQMGLYYDHEAFVPWWTFGNEHRLYALVHTMPNTGGVPCIARLAERFPDVNWLIPHTGQSWPYAEEVAACIRAHPNVYAELTITTVTNRIVEYLVEATDADHVIFGSDAPMRDPRPQLGWVVWSDLSVETRLKILGANYGRILSRVDSRIGRKTGTGG